MRISLLHCIGIFIVGWLGGLLLIQYIFDGQRGPSLRSGYAYHGREDAATQGGVAGLLNSVGKVFSDYSHLSGSASDSYRTRKERNLPRFPPHNATSSATGKEEQMFIYLDWPVDARLFTVDNYKALESMLTVYPTATFRCLLATSRDAYVHKVGNTLAVTQFAKYKKRGYDINVVPVNIKHKSASSSWGEAYREKWYEICCSKCNATCRAADHTQPYHLLNYIRLTSLYQHGGIFSDFSFFFLGPVTLDLVKQGYVITSWCGNQYHLESWQHDASTVELSSNRDRRGHGRKRGGSKAHDCVTSTLLVFHTPQHPALQCALKQYDDADFLQCLSDDDTYGGALCVKNAFDQCFESLKLVNVLQTPSDHSDGPAAANAGLQVTYNRESSVIEMFDQNAFRASNTLLSYEWSLEQERRIVWLGSLAWTGSWKHYPYRNGTLLSAAATTIALRGTNFPDLTTSAQCKGTNLAVPSSHYARNLSILARRGWYSTTGYSSAGTSQSLTYNTGIEETSCAPTVFIAGFQKSASTFLFDALTKHPSVLPALTGAQYKETNCYAVRRDGGADNWDGEIGTAAAGGNGRGAEKLLQRSWCYPFIEDGEPFVSVDGTVAYSLDYDVPETIKEDNPNAKILFIVRNPVERLYSAFKFAYATYAKFGNFDDFILPGMAHEHKFGQLREIVTNGTSVEEAVRYYYSRSYEDTPARGALFMHSLYALPVARYISVFGAANVKAVSAQDLDVQDPVRLYETLNSVFSFLGVCPLPITDLVPSLPSRNTVPISKQMSQDVFSRLTHFFRPFNTLLTTLTGLNTTVWNEKPPPLKLPKYSPLNKTLPELWFELKESAAATKKSHFLPQLLPQWTAEEKSDANSTLGMLNTF